MELAEGKRYVGLIKGRDFAFEIDEIEDEKNVYVVFEDGTEGSFHKVLVRRWIEDYQEYMSQFN